MKESEGMEERLWEIEDALGSVARLQLLTCPAVLPEVGEGHEGVMHGRADAQGRPQALHQ